MAPVRINGDTVTGQLINTGRGISFTVAETVGVDVDGVHHHHTQTSHQHQNHNNKNNNNIKPVTITDGPFSYTYTLANISLHFGRENNRGSEHTIDGMQFPGELQLYAYNSQLYTNWSEAKREPNGIVAVSVFIVLVKNPSISQNQNSNQQQQANNALKHITNSLKNITRRGQSANIIYTFFPLFLSLSISAYII